MTSFYDVVFTPSFVVRILHLVAACWMVGASLVMSVGAYYLLKKRHIELAKTMVRVALPLFTVLAILQVAVFGANQATMVAREQPVKLAAMEGLYETTTCAPMYLFGWSDSDSQTTTGLKIPCLLSLLTDKSIDGTVTGLETTPVEDQPNVNLVFQVYHLMINLGMLFIAIGVFACAMWIWGRRLWDQRWLLRILVGTIVLTEVATISGWWTAESSRQPWIVWEVLRTNDATSPNVSFGQVLFSIIMFVVLYILVFVVFIRLLDRKIKEGPPPPVAEEETASLPDSFGEIFRKRSRVSSGGD
jgi:cytochrome d ubiquinol oxidase subunit I